MTRESRMISGRVPTMVMTLSINGLTHDIELHERFFHPRYLKPVRVVKGVVVNCGNFRLTFHKKTCRSSSHANQ